MDRRIVNTFIDSFAERDFRITRAVVAKGIYLEAREAVVQMMSGGRGESITLRPHPTMPDNMAILFGSEGSFVVLKMEKQDEIRS